MTEEQLKERIKEIKIAIEQSVANHNGLLGRLAEANHLLAETLKLEADTGTDCAHSIESLEVKDCAV